MLRVRSVQLEALARSAEARTQERMLAHLREHFPAEIAGLDGGALAAFVARSTAEAQRFGLELLPDVLLYTNLAMAYGEGFLARPDLGWLRERMLDPTVDSARDRLRDGYEEAVRRHG